MSRMVAGAGTARSAGREHAGTDERVEHEPPRHPGDDAGGRRHGLEDYRLEEVPVPTLGPGEILVRFEAVGICASDLKCYHGAPKFLGDDQRPAWAATEVVPAHEFIGTVADLDDAARDKWGLGVGDRVVAEQIVPCWSCRYGLDGKYRMCEPRAICGFKRRTQRGDGRLHEVPSRIDRATG